MVSQVNNEDNQEYADISLEILDHLKKIQFIGAFPHGTLALLVSVSNALDEAQTVDITVTPAKLKAILKEDDILVFSNVDDWMKYKGNLKNGNTR